MTRLTMLSFLALLAAATWLDDRLATRGAEAAGGGDEGQATAEYALVLLGVAAIALAVVSWATRTTVIGKLLDLVFGGLLRKVT